MNEVFNAVVAIAPGANALETWKVVTGVEVLLMKEAKKRGLTVVFHEYADKALNSPDFRQVMQDPFAYTPGQPRALLIEISPEMRAVIEMSPQMHISRLEAPAAQTVPRQPQPL